MGYRCINLQFPTDYDEDMVKRKISIFLNIKEFSWQIENKSLDARKKNNIHWLLKLAVTSPELKGGTVPETETLEIPYKKRKEQAVIAGSGPAGFFCALTLLKAGFNVTLIERGSEVEKRGKSIQTFKSGGSFDPSNNYAFGEGGAGTFSDGKLTSRSKHISKEKQFIIQTYIQAGAPEEIAYMAHPHLGTDNLKMIVKNLRKTFLMEGGSILFDTQLKDIKIKENKVTAIVTNKGILNTDLLFIAPGHSAYETYRMLIGRGVKFRTKNFAIGSRMEHHQAFINKTQWGVEQLPGVKAAEYRLTSVADGKHPVYSFCMCPGGKVVPATAYAGLNIVNGMSYYKRDGIFANAACVAGIHPNELAGKEVTPIEALDKLEELERKFFAFSNGYKAPACSIYDFINQRFTKRYLETSYPLGIAPSPLWQMLPKPVIHSMQEGLKDFSNKLRGFENGILLGLESKTSSPIQVVREENGLCTGFENLYIVGEGSGYAGGIVSSAADGIRAAMKCCKA